MGFFAPFIIRRKLCMWAFESFERVGVEKQRQVKNEQRSAKDQFEKVHYGKKKSKLHAFGSKEQIRNRGYALYSESANFAD